MNDRPEFKVGLPGDVQVGGIVFRKGVWLSTFIRAARRWHREAHADVYALTDKQKAENLRRLQDCAAGVRVGDVVRQYATPARVSWTDALVTFVHGNGALDVRDTKTGECYGWSESMCEVVTRGVKAAPANWRELLGERPDGVVLPVEDQCPKCDPSRFCTRKECNKPDGVAPIDGQSFCTKATDD